MIFVVFTKDVYISKVTFTDIKFFGMVVDTDSFETVNTIYC